MKIMNKELHKVIADMTIRGIKLVNLNLIIIGDYNMGRKKLSKTQRVINAFERGDVITWTQLRNTFDLTSPQAMVDKLRSQGYMIYTNKSASGTSYRMGEPTQAIINAGVGAVLMNGAADKTIIAAGIKALYGNGVQFAS